MLFNLYTRVWYSGSCGQCGCTGCNVCCDYYGYYWVSCCTCNNCYHYYDWHLWVFTDNSNYFYTEGSFLSSSKWISVVSSQYDVET